MKTEIKTIVKQGCGCAEFAGVLSDWHVGEEFGRKMLYGTILYDYKGRFKRYEKIHVPLPHSTEIYAYDEGKIVNSGRSLYVLGRKEILRCSP